MTMNIKMNICLNINTSLNFITYIEIVRDWWRDWNCFHNTRVDFNFDFDVPDEQHDTSEVLMELDVVDEDEDGDDEVLRGGVNADHDDVPDSEGIPHFNSLMMMMLIMILVM